MIPKLLRTERLTLEPVTVVHSDRLFDLFQDPELYTYIPRSVPTDREKFRGELAFLEARLSYDGTQNWLRWAPIVKETGQIVGQIETTLTIESKECSLAYTIFREYWREGYAKEASSAVINHMFEDWGARNMIIEMDVRNAASVRLAESLAATRIAYTPNAQLLKGEWSNEYR